MASLENPLVTTPLKTKTMASQMEGLNNQESLNNQDCDTIQPLAVSPPGYHKKISNTPHQKKLMKDLPKRPPVDIQFENLSYSVQERQSILSIFRRNRGYKTILKGVSGKFKSGELTAIMGPSGAGKSTLMNIMAGYRTRGLVGDITINGKERCLRKFRKMSCYIMQDDCLNQHLTVLEAMNVAANLKLGEKMPQADKDRVIDVITSTLGLTECLHTRSSHISGGQRKRLAIALELVNNPPVMFFDEPTSGLDSSSCNQCISLLKELAREGRTIVCTIHQPSARIFEKFDKLYVLADGQTIYNGTTMGLVPFLGSMGLVCPSYHNPADFVMEVATGEHGQFTEKLVTAVQNGKCNNLSEGSPSGKTTILSVATSGIALTNDITKKDTEIVPAASNREEVCIDMTNEEGEDTGLSAYARNRGDPDGESFHHTSACKEMSEGNDTVNLKDSSNVKDTDGKGDIVNINDPVKSSLLTESVESIDEHCNTFPTSSWTQFCILFCRSIRSIMRDETLTKLRLWSHIAVALLLGGLYWDIGNEASKVFNNAAMLFFCMLFCMFTAMMPTVMTFPLEMATFKREHLNYWYSIKSYYLAKTFADMPFQILYPLTYIVIVYFMTGQPYEPSRFFMFAGMCICTSLVSQSLGLVIGAACDMATAIYLGPITTIPILLFSGFFVTFKNMPIYMHWMSYTAYVAYGFEGTMLAIYGFKREKLHCSKPYCHFKHPVKFLEEMAVDQAIYWVDVLALLGFFLGLRILGYFVLKVKVKMDR